MKYSNIHALFFALVIFTLGVHSYAKAYFHVVREGETLASIAQRYYGDQRKESVLVAENGLSGISNIPIVVGLRLSIPSVSYHRVQSNETWASIAQRYYGDSNRAFVIMGANQNTNDLVQEGAEILIPYPLRHVVGPDDTLQSIANFYYHDVIEGVRKLSRFNNLNNSRLERGQVVLVPLNDLILSESGRQAVRESTGEISNRGEIRSLQETANTQMPSLIQHNRHGRFIEAVTLGNHLLGFGQLTRTQIVIIQCELATAYVALHRNDLAVRAFQSALENQPNLQLNERTTSPTVLQALTRARQARNPNPSR